MVLRNIQGLEIVVRRFNLRAFDDGEANGEEDVLDFLEDLANEMVRADSADHAGEGEVDVILCEGPFHLACFDTQSLFFQRRFHIRL